MQRLMEVLQGRDSYWVDVKDTVRSSMRYLCDIRMGAVLVRAGDEVVGVFSERDLMHLINEDRNPDEVLVEEVMSRNPIRIYMNDDIKMAKALMHMNRVRHLVVISGEGDVLGLVSMRDLLEPDLAESKETIQDLNDKYYDKAYKASWRISSNRVITRPYVPQA